MKPFVISDFAIQQIQLGVFNAGPFLNPTLRMFQNDILISPSTVLADMVEATWGGYANMGMTPGGLLYRFSGLWTTIQFPGNTIQFAGGPGQICYGLYLTDDFGRLVYVGKFPTPLTFEVVGDTWFPELCIQSLGNGFMQSVGGDY